jgi:type 1 fimbria pilin
VNLIFRIMNKANTLFIEPATADNQFDSGEREYSPGLTPALVTAQGQTVIYTAPDGVAFRIRKFYAVPVVRGAENAPVVTLKLLNADGSLFKVFYIAAAVSERKQVTGPAGGKIAVTLDVQGRVPTTFDIEEF